MTSARIDAPGIPVPSILSEDVVVLPRELSDEDVGLYDDSVITLVKELQQLGVDARFQHGPDARSWIGEKAVAKIVIDLIVGIGSSAGWSAVCRLFGQAHKDDRVRVRAGRFRGAGHGATTSWEWYEFEGTGDAVAKAMAQIEPPAGTDAEEEQEALET